METTSHDIGSPLMHGSRRTLALASGLGGLIAVWLSSATTPALVGPDASMYASIAVSVTNGYGLTFPDGTLVTERPPLMALVTAVLAGPLGDPVLAETLLSKVGFVALAIACAWLATRAAGVLGGLAVSVLFLASPMFVRWSGATLVDGVAGALAMAAIAVVTDTGTSRRRWAVFGVLLGLSFLTKETAILLLIVPGLIAVIRPGSIRARLDLVLAALAGFALAVTPWFTWVAVQTGQAYLLQVPGVPAAAGAIVAVAIAGLVRHVYGDREVGTSPWVAGGLVALICGAWVVLGWFAAERAIDTGVDTDLPRAIYRYGRLTLAPDLPLLVLGSAAAVLGSFMAFRRPGLRPVVLAALAGAPLIASVASRGWEARSLVLVLALGAVLAGVGVAASLDWLRARRPVLGAVLVTGGIALATGAALGPTMAAVAGHHERVDRGTWDRPEIGELAAWLDHRLPDRGHVMMSWQYAAMAYVRGHGAFVVRQVPLGRANWTGDPARPLIRTATFGGWEDERVPEAVVGPLIYVSDARPTDLPVVLERSALATRIVELESQIVIVVDGGPVERSGGNYPAIGRALGAGAPELSLATGNATIEAYAVPADARYASTEVSLDPRAATRLMAGDAGADIAALDAIGAVSVRIWPGQGLDATVLADLQATGRPVVVDNTQLR